MEFAKVKYNKPPTTFDEQIQLLESRGMIVPDHDRAHHYLSHLNYYRIGAYWLPFETDHSSHQFKKATNFDPIALPELYKERGTGC